MNIDILNTSVLNKMPRDCTAHDSSVALEMYSPGFVDLDPIHRLVLWTNSLAMQSQSALTNMLRRAETKDFLSGLVKAHKLTSDGKEWLTAALDPFHDYEHQIAGYPDADVSQTVVSCYQYEYAIAQPVGMGGVGNWDCHVCSYPIASSHGTGRVLSELADWSTLVAANPNVVTALGPVVVYTAPTGSNLGFSIPAIATVQCIPGDGVEDVSSGCSRVVAGGFEVHNTTAEIYKQGSVTTYRMPQNHGRFQATLVGPAQYGTVTGSRVRGPPLTIAQANLLKGTRTWNAKEGVYATLFQSTAHNPLVQMSTDSILIERQSDPGLPGTVASTPFEFHDAGPQTPIKQAATQSMPFDTTGAMFTGLSPQTTLTLKVKLFVERAPTWNEPALAVLASPSAGYDLSALQLYAQVINMLPPAVMVGENAKGDWWRAVVSVIKHVAAPLGIALEAFVPGAGLVGGAISSVAGQVDTRRPIASQSVAQAKAARPRQKVSGQKQKPPSQKTQKRKQLLLTM